MNYEQRVAIEGYVDSALLPVIRSVLVKKLGQSAEFMASELLSCPDGDNRDLPMLKYLELAAEHIASLGQPVDFLGRYDKDGEWTFIEAVPNPVNESAVRAAYAILRNAMTKFGESK